MSVTCFAQDSLSIEPRQINEADSIHVDTHTLLDNKLEDVTKTKGDSAYIKEDVPCFCNREIATSVLISK